MPNEIGKWTDKVHQENPEFKIGLSEYGAGASAYQHQNKLTKATPRSRFHPEDWQAYYHEEYWKVINERPYIWGTYIWNLYISQTEDIP